MQEDWRCVDDAALAVLGERKVRCRQKAWPKCCSLLATPAPMCSVILTGTLGIAPAVAATASVVPQPIVVAGIPIDFILFGLTLLGVALFHHYTLQVALWGLAAITLYKLAFTGFKFGG